MKFVLLFYFIIFVVVWWGYSGYFVFLYIVHKCKKQYTIESRGTDLPTMTVLVPCYNEERFAKVKIENLLKLEYPKEKLNVLFLDGMSTDNTFASIKGLTKEVDHIDILQTNVRGKILQINSVIKNIKSDIIVNTDMDGIMEHDILLRIIDDFNKDKNIGVVGAYVIPMDCSNEESFHWDMQNRIRVMEGLAYSSSVVVAVCYAFKNGIIDKFYDDVIADDVCIAFESNMNGHKVMYSTDAIAFEMRASKTKKEFIMHKFRKTNANIVETLKYLRKLQVITKKNLLWFIIFITRAVQIICVPVLIMLFFILSLFLLYKNHFELVISLFIIMFVSTLVNNKILSSLEVPVESKDKHSALVGLKTNFLILVIMICAVLSYPFYKQSSNYKKI